MKNKYLIIPVIVALVSLGAGILVGRLWGGVLNSMQSDDSPSIVATDIPDKEELIEVSHQEDYISNENTSSLSDSETDIVDDLEGTVESETTEKSDENPDRAELFRFQGDAFSTQEDIHAAIATYEISLQYQKNPDVMYKTAELYRTLQKTEGDGYDHFWNFDRATQLYFESYGLTGNSDPIVSFCIYCDEYIIDPTMSDGYKEKILEANNIEVVFVRNLNLKEGEYIYNPDFDINGGVMTIETHELPAWELYEESNS